MRAEDTPETVVAPSLVSTLRSYATVVGMSGSAALLSFLTAILLARNLTPSQFGYFSILFSAMNVLWTATNFGDSAYIRFVNAGTGEPRHRYLGGVFFIEATTIAGLAVCAVPAAWFISRQLLGNALYFDPLVLGMLLGLGLNFVSLWAAIYQAEDKFFVFSLLRTIANFFVFAGVLGLVVVFSVTLGRVYAVHAAVVGAMTVAAVVAVSRRMRPFDVDRVLVRKLLSFSKWLMAGNVAYVLSQRLDVFVLAAFAPAAAVGHYGAAVRVSVAASLFTGSIAPLLLPRATRVGGSREDLVSYLRHVARFAGVLVGVIAVIWATIPLWVPVLLGESYSDAIPVARILLVGSGCVAAYTPLSQLFVAQERPIGSLMLPLIKLVSLALFLLLFVPRFDAAGGAWAVAGAEAAALTFTCFAVWRRVGRSRSGSQGLSA